MDLDVGDGLAGQAGLLTERLATETLGLACFDKSLTQARHRRFARHRVRFALPIRQPAWRDTEELRKALDGVDSRQRLATLDEIRGGSGTTNGSRGRSHTDAGASAGLAQPVGQTVVGGIASSSNHAQDITAEKPRVQLRVNITSQMYLIT